MVKVKLFRFYSRAILVIRGFLFSFNSLRDSIGKYRLVFLFLWRICPFVLYHLRGKNRTFFYRCYWGAFFLNTISAIKMVKSFFSCCTVLMEGSKRF